MKPAYRKPLSVLLFLVLGTCGCAWAQQGGDYLPMAKGRKWVLRSPASEEPVILEVLSKKGQEYQMRFDNPWVKSEMTLESRRGRFYVTAVTMGGNRVAMAPETLYFDLTAPEGKTWRNGIGTLAVVTRRKTVQANGKTYGDCIQIRETTKEGNQLYWTFARNIGFVQFGEGNGAFVLDPSASSLRAGAAGDDAPPIPAEEKSENYLPLAEGKQWVLRSPASKEPVVLEILRRRGGVYELRFDNPWVDSTMSIRARGGRHYVTAVTMGGGTASMPEDTLYFDLTAPEGKTWSNQIGTLSVVSRKKVVATRTGTYQNCIQIREVNKQGNELFWTFAPGIGFVQFGEGRNAFVLDAASESPAGSTSEASDFADFGRRRLLVALAANTFANETFNEQSVRARFRQSLDAGVTYVYLSPKWDELEPRKGKYNWKDIDFQVSQAVQANLPVVCNVRIVDTGNRAMPADLKGLSFRDARVQKRLLALLDGLLPRLKDRGQLLLVGNEVDSYFRGHRSEVAEYASLFDAARQKIRSWKAGTPVSLSITFEGLHDLDSFLRPLMERTDFFALTYYPLKPDFTFRDPSVVRGDFSRIVSAAGRKKILFQEIGYSSSSENGSSQEKQAEFYANVFDSLGERAEVVLGANFLFMSDLPDSVVDSLAGYYNLPNASRFKAFLRTLGIFDQRGRPKKSWQVFREQALRVKERRG